jgi:hypothetical protein
VTFSGVGLLSVHQGLVRTSSVRTGWYCPYMPKDARLEVRLERELLDRLPRDGRERSRLVREALEAALGQPEAWSAPVVSEEPPVSPRASAGDLSRQVIRDTWIRQCERCGNGVSSPTLARCVECNGKIVPPPV